MCPCRPGYLCPSCAEFLGNPPAAPVASRPKFRLVRSARSGVNPSTEKAYRVETVELLSEKEALALMRELGSPYKGKKYDA